MSGKFIVSPASINGRGNNFVTVIQTTPELSLRVGDSTASTLEKAAPEIAVVTPSPSVPSREISINREKVEKALNKPTWKIDE